MELQARPAEVMRAVETVQAFGREKRLREREIFGLALALEECSSNSSEPERNVHMALETQILKDVSSRRTGAATIKLIGSLDTATAPELERQLAPLLAGDIKDIVFDLEQLRFISSAGLRVFSTARKQLKERSGQASFVRLQPQIQEVFDIMKALPGVAIFKSAVELDSYLTARQRSHTDPE